MAAAAGWSSHVPAREPKTVGSWYCGGRVWDLMESEGRTYDTIMFSMEAVLVVRARLDMAVARRGLAAQGQVDGAAAGHPAAPAGGADMLLRLATVPPLNIMNPSREMLLCVAAVLGRWVTGLNRRGTCAVETRACCMWGV